MADEEEVGHILAQFRSEDGENTGAPFDLPLSVTTEHLQAVCNQILENVRFKFYFIISYTHSHALFLEFHSYLADHNVRSLYPKFYQ